MPRPGRPFASETDLQQKGDPNPVLLRADDPEHKAKHLRLTRGFTVRRVNALTPEIQRITDESIDGLRTAGSPPTWSASSRCRSRPSSSA